MSAENYSYELEFAVRDYECDLQGVVNNSVYQNYLEHTRHEYLKSLGIDFAALHEQGHNLVVTRCEIDYKRPLRSGDRFVVRLNMKQESRLRFVFEQDIYNLPDEQLIVKGRIIGTSLNQRGRPEIPEPLKEILVRNTEAEIG